MTLKPLIRLYLVCYCAAAFASERFYTLDLEYRDVNITGNPARAMLINGSLPGPTLEFTEGDIAVIRVNNYLDTPASVHWHGLLLPQDQDGVPYLTFLPIAPGQGFTYRFPITHAGTYWYHSHTNIDEQRGQYGSIVVHPGKPDTTLSYQHDVVVQLSDWTDEHPLRVLGNLKKDGDWYSSKKGSVVNLWDYLKRDALAAWFTNRRLRMDGMDVSDVGYDAFLANGRQTLKLLPQAHPGDVVRIRLINSAASTHFLLQQSGTPFTVIAADGPRVESVTVEEILVGMAETYDLLVTVPESGGLEINANSIDGAGNASIRIGDGQFPSAPKPLAPDLYQAMTHNRGNAGHHHHNHHNQGQTPGRLDYTMLQALRPVTYSGSIREVRLNLTGDMETYNWSFNNTPLSAADAIKINRGEVVRFVFNNTTMMRHPLHLHGHFFKVISGNGPRDVLKHTVDVPPMGRVVIEFAANEEKDWLFHCHNLYHAKTGMARVVRYRGYGGNKAFTEAKARSREIADSDWYPRIDTRFYSNYGDIEALLSNSRYALLLEAERTGWSETEATFSAQYRLNRWTQAYLGSEYETGESAEYRVGINYLAPYGLDTHWWLNSEGELHVGLGFELQLTSRLALETAGDTDADWFLELAYRRSPNLAWKLGKRDNAGWGVGIEATF